MRPASRTHKVAMQPHMVLPMTLSKWCWSRVVMVMLPPGAGAPPLIVAAAHPPVSDAQHSRDVLLGTRTAVWLDGQVQEAGLADGPGQHLYLSDLSRERRVERTPPIDMQRNASAAASVTTRFGPAQQEGRKTLESGGPQRRSCATGDGTTLWPYGPPGRRPCGLPVRCRTVGEHGASWVIRHVPVNRACVPKSHPTGVEFGQPLFGLVGVQLIR
jgi:hypothetical protein